MQGAAVRALVCCRCVLQRLLKGVPGLTRPGCSVCVCEASLCTFHAGGCFAQQVRIARHHGTLRAALGIWHPRQINGRHA